MLMQRALLGKGGYTGVPFQTKASTIFSVSFFFVELYRGVEPLLHTTSNNALIRTFSVLFLQLKNNAVPQYVSHRTIKCQIPLVATKRYEGQRVTLWRQPSTQTNRDPNHDLCQVQPTENTAKLLA